MKAIAIDSSEPRLCVAAVNGNDRVTCTYDIGMRQSETLLGAIDYVICKAALDKATLDCAALCAGPGSFTGLRISYAALKAVHLAFGTPVYAVPTLTAIAWQYRFLPFTVLPVLDARKERFYAAAYNGGVQVLHDGDYTVQDILAAIYASPPSDKGSNASSAILAAGSGAHLFASRAAAVPASSIQCGGELMPIYTLDAVNTADALFAITDAYIQEGKSAIEDFDGPLYLRPCDAETKRTQVP